MEHTFISGFHHIGLKCADIEKSIAMYQALGMKEVMRRGEGSGRVVMLDRDTFFKRRKALVSRGNELANNSGTMV